ncbi:TPA: hypothetical protein N0F65_008734 [Lagenidium giganteum]|uniref:Uncharacterized protein n=1 Tax=Lagenidium giganteum TaxID=4803 RepID=A0AAV2Z3G5_9STRA|nr:TPA: hypothetical protein N0F65_008734 [Lagenidium giganteum]
MGSTQYVVADSAYSPSLHVIPSFKNVDPGRTAYSYQVGKSDEATLDHAAVKRRFDALVETARRDDLESLRASGTVEEYEKRKQLLTDVRMLLDHFLEKKDSQTQAEQRQIQLRAQATSDIIGMAMAGVKRRHDDDDDSTADGDFVSPRKRKATSRIADHLEQKGEKRYEEAQLRRMELEHQQRRIDIEERRACAEREERQTLMGFLATTMASMQRQNDAMMQLMAQLRGKSDY